MLVPDQRRVIALDNTPNQPSKFRAQNCVETNDDARGTYKTNSQIEFKSSILNPNLCDYSNVYILVSGTITVVGAGANPVAITADRNNKQGIFKNCAPFINSII